MKRLILVGTLAVGVCLAGLCLGQETTGSANESPSSQEQLKALAYFLGGWELTGEINLAGQPTMKFAYERQFKWDLGNNFIQTTTTETKDGKTELRHRSMFGWEPKTQRIIEWGFWNLNLPTETSNIGRDRDLVQDGEKWRIEREGIAVCSRSSTRILTSTNARSRATTARRIAGTTLPRERRRPQQPK